MKRLIEDENKTFEDIFTVTNSVKGKPIAYCSNVQELLKRIKQRRNDNPDYYKIGLDFGQGSLKLVLSALDSTEIGQKDEYKKSGVKGALILAVALETQESHESIKILLDQTDLVSSLSGENWFLSSDLKVKCSRNQNLPQNLNFQIKNVKMECDYNTSSGLDGQFDCWHWLLLDQTDLVSSLSGENWFLSSESSDLKVKW